MRRDPRGSYPYFKEEKMADHTNGKWHAATLGQFIGQLVDEGGDAVIFRLVSEYGYGPVEGYVTRRWEIVVPAKGTVKGEIALCNCESVHKTLAALIKAGIVA